MTNKTLNDSFSHRKRTTPYIIGYVVILSILAIVFIIKNSSRMILDTRAYPIQMEMITDFGDNLCKRIPLDTLWNGQNLFLDLHFGLPSSANYIQIASYNEASIVSRINVESSELVKGTPTSYVYQKYLKGNTDDFGTLYITSYSESDTKLLRVNLDKGENIVPVDTIHAFSVKDFNINEESWDCGFTGMIFFPEDNQGPVDVFIQLGSGISRYPRFLIGYHIDENNNFVEIFRKNIGNPLRYPCFYDIDKDGCYEVIYGTSAPSNEKHGSGLSDTNQYIIAFNQSGEVVWKHNFGIGGGATMIVPHSTNDSLMVVARMIFAFSPEANSSYVYSFQPWDGTILDTTKYDGFITRFESEFKDPSRWLIDVNRSENTISWIGEDFKITSCVRFPVSGSHMVVGSFNVNGEIYCLINFLNGWAGLVDKNFKLMGVFEGEYELVDKGINDDIADDLYIRKCNTNYVNGEKRSRYYHARLKQKPFIHWFVWRNRWIIISWAILIIAVPGMIAIIRYIRLKIAARKAIEEMNEQRSQLIQKLHKSQENERSALSREIHDNFGQLLVVLQWGIESIEPDLLNKKLLEANKKQLKDTVEELLASIHEISSGLRPPVFDAGLFKTIEWQTKNFSERTGINCIFDNNADHEPQSKELVTSLYRVIQESLTNIIKHAGATEIKISLYEKEKSFIIEVVDNGKGIKEKENGQRVSLGLLGMNERLIKYNGKVKLKNNQNYTGVTLSVSLPITDVDYNRKEENHEYESIR